MAERNIIVESLLSEEIEKLPVEIVERKGIGHPDSIMDGMMEEVSRELSREYKKMFSGAILHHNTDKGQLSSGRVERSFGEGRFLKPVNIILSGQATFEHGGKMIPVDEIAKRAAMGYLRKAVPLLAREEQVEIESKIAECSTDLTKNYESKGEKLKGKVPMANDTSFGVGFWPLSATESLVKEIEEKLNADEYKRKNPSVGTDIKVMGLREGREITLTVAAAIIASRVKSLEEYSNVKKTLEKDITLFAKRALSKRKGYFLKEIKVNTADGGKADGSYITVTGTSAEGGDAGAVGRGNRVNGLITPMRPMSLEAAAGKNPVSHVGKIYNLLANEIAKEIVSKSGTVRECHVKILSRIGTPIDMPLVCEVQIASSKMEKDAVLARKVADRMLGDIVSLREKVLSGKLSVF